MSNNIFFVIKQISLSFALATLMVFLYFFTIGYEKVIIFENNIFIRFVEISLSIFAIAFIGKIFIEGWREGV